MQRALIAHGILPTFIPLAIAKNSLMGMTSQHITCCNMGIGYDDQEIAAYARRIRRHSQPVAWAGRRGEGVCQRTVPIWRQYAIRG